MEVELLLEDRPQKWGENRFFLPNASEYSTILTYSEVKDQKKCRFSLEIFSTWLFQRKKGTGTQDTSSQRKKNMSILMVSPGNQIIVSRYGIMQGEPSIFDTFLDNFH